MNRMPPFGVSTFLWASPFSSDRLEVIDKAAMLGFDLVEVCLEQPDALDLAALARRLKDHGLAATICGAFGGDRNVSAGEEDVRQEGIRYLHRCIDAAALLGARLVGGPMYAAAGRPQLLDRQEEIARWERAVDALGAAADYAASGDVCLAIEPINRFESSMVNTTDQGLQLVADIGRPNVGLLLDTFHMNIEERSIAGAIERAGSKVFHFHACANDRGVPGCDPLNWPAIAAALDRANYSGPWVIEAFTRESTSLAQAVSLWRDVAESQDSLAIEGLAFLRNLNRINGP